MQTAIINRSKEIIENQHVEQIQNLVQQSFKKIAPFWPLKNLIAINPLQGFEDMPIESALNIAAAYFQQPQLPVSMAAVNRETIKWLQVYFDQGQATLTMPFRRDGLYAAWRQLAIYDNRLHGNDQQKQAWLRALPQTAKQAIMACLLRLDIASEERKPFLILMLTTLPGWAAHIKYRTEWAGLEAAALHPVTQADYLALRLIITSLLWPGAKALLQWHSQSLKNTQLIKNPLVQITMREDTYRLSLFKKLAVQPLKTPHTPQAQLVFCIDVRSEPFRRALEATGDYQTLGFAGFFGIPVKITDSVTGESYASCPVLLAPKYEITETPCCSQAEHNDDQQGYQRLNGLKRLYQSIKYTFTTPFALVETLGIPSGAWMAVRSLFPGFAAKLKTAATHTLRKPRPVQPALDTLSIMEQCAYAESALRMMGVTHSFAPLVIFCGHGSTTQNNAYATALDCGACGGRHGASNARLITMILNQTIVRKQLATKGITIPDNTHFIAAEHNTTTDEVLLYDTHLTAATQKLKHDLEKARSTNSAVRLKQLGAKAKKSKVALHTERRSQDWAEVRPEWGLARNAAFIVAPRHLTQAVDLEGRAFLHSYDWQKDPSGTSLTTILTAPMVVAQWINSQYLFSTIDNVAYGAGSKVTKNITGKMGIMQGNASDLMHGLPLQSVYRNDKEPYHEALRLLTVVYAPRRLIDKIMSAQAILQKLVGHGWINFFCLDPSDHKFYRLSRDFSWENEP